MSDSPEKKPDWERSVLEKVALAAINEQRTARRWGLFFNRVRSWSGLISTMWLNPDVETEVMKDSLNSTRFLDDTASCDLTRMMT